MISLILNVPLIIHGLGLTSNELRVFYACETKGVFGSSESHYNYVHGRHNYLPKGAGDDVKGGSGWCG